MKRKLFAYLFVLFAGAMTLACAQQNVATQVKRGERANRHRGSDEPEDEPWN
ncbi:MAG: hypothetical protein L6U16_11425 [Porphyromonadaceae bacterium]|nr:MAG: hypothetical protein L6U16_11425 [Porphyromonadaceae bacterium]